MLKYIEAELFVTNYVFVSCSTLNSFKKLSTYLNRKNVLENQWICRFCLNSKKLFLPKLKREINLSNINQQKDTTKVK